MIIRNTFKEAVDYHHPVLHYKIWDYAYSPLTASVWNKWHYHKEIEILWVVEGSMQIETVDHLYDLQEQDIIVLGASRPHRTNRQQHVKQIVMQFDMMAQLDQFTNSYMPILLELSDPLDRINEILAKNETFKNKVFEIIRSIHQETNQMLPGYEVAVSGAIKQLLALFIRYLPSSDPISLSDWMRLKPVLDYIEVHYTGSIRIPDVLHLVHLEYHYFIKFFQKCIGMSFVEYLHYKRIKKAEHLLLTEPFSIVDVGIQSGFQNNSQFLRIFKRMNGCTPSDFRKKKIQ